MATKKKAKRVLRKPLAKRVRSVSRVTQRRKASRKRGLSSPQRFEVHLEFEDPNQKRDAAWERHYARLARELDQTLGAKCVHTSWYVAGKRWVHLRTYRAEDRLQAARQVRVALELWLGSGIPGGFAARVAEVSER